jgi:hypothetical protein
MVKIFSLWRVSLCLGVCLVGYLFLDLICCACRTRRKARWRFCFLPFSISYMAVSWSALTSALFPNFVHIQ